MSQRSNKSASSHSRSKGRKIPSPAKIQDKRESCGRPTAASLALRVKNVLRGKLIPPNLYDYMETEFEIEKEEQIGVYLKGDLVVSVLAGTTCQGKIFPGDILLTINGQTITDSTADNQKIFQTLKKSSKKVKAELIRLKSRFPVDEKRIKGYERTNGFDYYLVLLYFFKKMNIGMDVIMIDNKIYVDKVTDNNLAQIGLGWGDSVVELENKFPTSTQEFIKVLQQAFTDKGVALMTVEIATTEAAKNYIRHKMNTSAPAPPEPDLGLPSDVVTLTKKQVDLWKKQKDIEPKPILRETSKSKSHSPNELTVNDHTKIHALPSEINMRLMIHAPPPVIWTPKPLPPVAPSEFPVPEQPD